MNSSPARNSPRTSRASGTESWDTALVSALIFFGVVAFAWAAFVSDPNSPDLARREPWTLFFWLCGVVLTVQIFLLRDPALPLPRAIRDRPLAIPLLVTLLWVLVVTVYRLTGLIDPTLLARAFSAALSALRLSILDSRRAAFSLILLGIIALFWLDALARRFRRRPEEVAPPGTAADVSVAGTRLPGENFAGDLVAAAALSLVLAPLFTRPVMGFILGATDLSQCDVSWFVGACSGGGAAAQDPPTLLFINLVLLPLSYLAIGLLILLISAIVRAWRGSEEEVGVSVLTTLRAAVERRFTLLNLRRSLQIFWPLFLLGAVVSAAAAAVFIERYLQSVMATQQGSATVAVNATNPLRVIALALTPDAYLWQFVAALCGVLLLLATVAAVSLQAVPRRAAGSLSLTPALTREATYSQLRLRRVGLIVGQTYWIFAVLLTLLNALLLATRLTTRVAFIEPEPLTVLSFVVFVVVTARWWRTRAGRAHARAVAADAAAIRQEQAMMQPERAVDRPSEPLPELPPEPPLQTWTVPSASGAPPTEEPTGAEPATPRSDLAGSQEVHPEADAASDMIERQARDAPLADLPPDVPPESGIPPVSPPLEPVVEAPEQEELQEPTPDMLPRPAETDMPTDQPLTRDEEE